VTKPLIVEPKAEEELEAAIRWYEQRGPRLGERFLRAVAATMDWIRRFPQAGGLVPQVGQDLGVRRAPVRRFPYHVVYLDAPEAMHVLAIAHDRRKPGYWLGRVTP
jgi:plasmid stabilization system protein ParE